VLLGTQEALYVSEGRSKRIPSMSILRLIIAKVPDGPKSVLIPRMDCGRSSSFLLGLRVQLIVAETPHSAPSRSNNVLLRDTWIPKTGVLGQSKNPQPASISSETTRVQILRVNEIS